MRYVIVEDGAVKQVIMADNITTAKLIAGKNKAIQSDTANIGDAYKGDKFIPRGSDQAPAPIDALVDKQMRFRIEEAYVDVGHMQSAHAYMAQLSAEMNIGKISDDEKADLLLLTQAGRWEDAMVNARDAIIATGDAMKIHDNSNWPAPPAGLMDLAKKC